MGPEDGFFPNINNSNKIFGFISRDYRYLGCRLGDHCVGSLNKVVKKLNQ